MSAAGTILGFQFAFLLYLVTQLWRERRQRGAFRQALLVQLQALEAVLSTTVVSVSYGLDDPSAGVQEFHWYLAEGRSRIVPSPFPEALAYLKGRSEKQKFLKEEAQYERGIQRSF